MTLAILAWQLLIFASICMSRRWRTWMIAFWVVWTVFQVAAFSLSVIQFATIAAAAALTRKSLSKPALTARVPEAPPIPPARQDAVSTTGSAETAGPGPDRGNLPVAARPRMTIGELLQRHATAARTEDAFRFPSTPAVARVPTESPGSSTLALHAERHPYVTRSTFLKLSTTRLDLATNPADDVLLPLLYRHPLQPFFNSSELRALLVLKTMFMGGAGLKVLPARQQPRYVFKIHPPKFHLSKDCEYLRAPFSNYLLPAEIAALGEDKVGEFQQFCQANRAAFSDKPDDVFWAHVGAHFNVSIQPQPVRHSNSGVQRVDRSSVASIAQAIDMHYAALASAMDDPVHGQVVARLRYAPALSGAPRTIKDRGTRDFMETFYADKRALADLLFDLYRHQAGANDYQLPLALLEKLGLQACKGCR